MAKQALCEALSLEEPTPTFLDLKPSVKPAAQATSYASSTENIARLLKGWMRNPTRPARRSSSARDQSYSFGKMGSAGTTVSTSSEGTDQQLSAANNNGMELCEALESLYGFDSFVESSNSDFSGSASPDATCLFQDESKPDPNVQLPLSLLEKWLFDEGVTQGKEQGLNNMTPDDQNANFF